MYDEPQSGFAALSKEPETGPHKPSAEVARALDTWSFLADSYEGEGAIKKGRVKYLPKLSAQTEEDYAGYLCRAHYYGATRATLQGLLGLTSRKAPKVELAPGLEPLREDASADGTPLVALARDATKHALGFARAALLVEIHEDSPTPRLALYSAASLLSVRRTVRAGVETITRAVLSQEYTETDPADEWREVCGVEWLVLDLDGGIYRQRVYRKVKDRDGKESLIVVRESYPRPLGSPGLDFLPLVVFGCSRVGTAIEEPPLLALAEENIRHYRQDADIAHGLHMTALPTPWFAGDAIQGTVDANGQSQEPVFTLGPGNAWRFRAGTQVGMLEFTGAGIGAYREAQKETEAHMVALGAQLLAPQKREAETAEAMRLRNAASSALLSTVCDTVGEALTLSLRYAAVIVREDPALCSVVLSKDFFDTKLTPQELAALVAGWQAGALTSEALANALYQGELLPAGETAESYAEVLESERERKRNVAAQIATQPQGQAPEETAQTPATNGAEEVGSDAD